MIHLDGAVLARALIYAVASIDGLPVEIVPERLRKKVIDDRNDMVHVLHLMVEDPALREQMAAEVEQVTGRLADLTDWAMR